MRFTTIALASLALACQPKPAPVDTAGAVAAIKAADAAWEKASSGKDTAAAFSAVEPTGSILAPNAPAATGPDGVRAFFNGVWALPNISVHWTLSDAQVAQSGEIGYSHGNYELSFTDPKGNAIKDHGKYLTVWRKQTDGSWKVVMDMFNTDVPLPAM